LQSVADDARTALSIRMMKPVFAVDGVRSHPCPER
jgi:hypothetical protein